MQEPIWIDEPAALERLLETLAAQPAYALDTEFHRERSYFPHVALIQIGWKGGIALVDPLAVDAAPLAKVLQGSALAVLHAADQDLEVLQKLCGCVPTRLFDTQIAGAFLGRGFSSLTRLVQDVVGLQLTKGDRLTDWTRRPLSPAQLAYAASDVAHLLEIEATLRREAEASGVLLWVEEECERLRTRNFDPPDPENAWWKIKGSRGLAQRQKAVAQEVAAWREQTAARRDIPPRFVLSDLALAGIVQRAPRNPGELAQIRGLEGRGLKGNPETEVLAAVARGLALAVEDVRLPPRGEPPLEEVGPVVTLGLALVAGIAAERGIEPSVLATRGDVQGYLSGRTGTRLHSGWRKGLAAEALENLRAGRVALASDGEGGIRVIALADDGRLDARVVPS